MKPRKMWHWLSLLAAFQLTLSCGGIGGSNTTSTADTSETGSSSGTASSFKISGSLETDSLGLSSLQLLASEIIIKATYAKQEEDKGTLGTDGGYDITVKPEPFALTIFVDSAPTCTFIFNVGEQKVGSIKASGDMNLGRAKCVDGQVNIDESVISGKLDEEFKNKIALGEISDEIRAKLLDPEGLKLTMLSAYAEKGSKGGNRQEGGKGGQPQGPQGASASAPAASGPAGAPGPAPAPAPGPGGPTPSTGIPAPGGAAPGGQFLVGGPGPQGPGNGMVDPKLCTEAGYSVPEFFFQDYYAGEGEEGDNAPTLFVEDKGEGQYVMRAESKGSDGQAEVEVFEKLKLGGIGEEFALVGEALLNPREVKAMAAEGVLREIMYSMNTGNEAPPMPTWTDMSCDPVNIVNQIVTNLGHQAYDVKSVFQNTCPGCPQPQWAPGGGQQAKPLCSAVSGGNGGAQLTTIKDLCYEADGVKLKAQTVTAAKMICQVANEAGPANYWNAVLKDANGNPIKSCIKESNNSWGTDFKQEFLDKTEGECNALRNAAWASPPTDGSWVNYDWRDMQRNMNRDCSELRLNNISLKECLFNSDNKLEPNYVFPSHDQQPQPDKWWDGKYTLVDAAAAIDEAKAKLSFGGGMSPLAHLKENIDRCTADFDRTVKELNKRREKINGITTALNLIASSKDANGNLQYIKEEKSKYVKHGDFSFTSEEITSLQSVLKKAVTSLDGWADSIKKIKDTYAVLKRASLKAEEGEATKCLADEIGTKDAFKTIYDRFNYAYNGATGDKTNRGLKKWQDAAMNHFQCMEMDQNLRRIRDFGMNAPLLGIEDSLAETSSDDLFLRAEDEADECDFTDHRGRCIKTVACKIPAGAETYIPFTALLDKAEVQAGCDITQKVAMMGRINELEHKVNGITVPEGQLIANVLLMTSMPKKDCSIILKIPKQDKDACFVYVNEAGDSWADLTDDQRKSATASNYSLKYYDKKVPILNIANREVFQVMLTPGSEVTSAKEEAGADEETSSGGSDLDELISQ